MTTIELVDAREILDSRGNPTVEVDVVPADGVLFRRRSCASGPSTGAHGSGRAAATATRRASGRKGVLGAVANVIDTIGPSAVRARRCGPGRQRRALCELDGLAQQGVKPRCERAPGRSAGVRLRRGRVCVVRPAALSLSRRRRGDRSCCTVLQHPQSRQSTPQDLTDFQEFMIAPVGLDDLRRGPAAGAEVFKALRTLLRGGSRDRPGRRGRVRAQPADQPGRHRDHPARDRARRLSTER